MSDYTNVLAEVTGIILQTYKMPKGQDDQLLLAIDHYNGTDQEVMLQVPDLAELGEIQTGDRISAVGVTESWLLREDKVKPSHVLERRRIDPVQLVARDHLKERLLNISEHRGSVETFGDESAFLDPESKLSPAAILQQIEVLDNGFKAARPDVIKRSLKQAPKTDITKWAEGLVEGVTEQTIFMLNPESHSYVGPYKDRPLNSLIGELFGKKESEDDLRRQAHKNAERHHIENRTSHWIKHKYRPVDGVEDDSPSHFTIMAKGDSDFETVSVAGAVIPYTAWMPDIVMAQRFFTSQSLAQILPKQNPFEGWMKYFVTAHEVGHAVMAQQTMLTSSIQRSNQHFSEIYADCFALLAIAQKGADADTLQAFVDLRKIGKLFGSVIHRTADAGQALLEEVQGLKKLGKVDSLEPSQMAEIATRYASKFASSQRHVRSLIDRRKAGFETQLERHKDVSEDQVEKYKQKNSKGRCPEVLAQDYLAEIIAAKSSVERGLVASKLSLTTNELDDCMEVIQRYFHFGSELSNSANQAEGLRIWEDSLDACWNGLGDRLNLVLNYLDYEIANIQSYRQDTPQADRNGIDQRVEKTLSEVAQIVGYSADLTQSDPASRWPHTTLEEDLPQKGTENLFYTIPSGCGKTNLAKHYLEQPAKTKLALLMDQIGEEEKLVGVDAVEDLSADLHDNWLNLRRKQNTILWAIANDPVAKLYAETKLGHEVLDVMVEASDHNYYKPKKMTAGLTEAQKLRLNRFAQEIAPALPGKKPRQIVRQRMQLVR